MIPHISKLNDDAMQSPPPLPSTPRPAISLVSHKAQIPWTCSYHVCGWPFCTYLNEVGRSISSKPKVWIRHKTSCRIVVLEALLCVPVHTAQS